MKVVIAGGRDYNLQSQDLEKLNKIKDKITEVVSGGAKGVDSCAENWAKLNNIPIKIFFADWNNHGKMAGPIRNKQMAEYADAVILFPGGKGTENMYKTAKKMNLTIYDFRKIK